CFGKKSFAAGLVDGGFTRIGYGDSKALQACGDSRGDSGRPRSDHQHVCPSCRQLALLTTAAGPIPSRSPDPLQRECSVSPVLAAGECKHPLELRVQKWTKCCQPS